ncbi:hypothetical protein, partial [Pseudomonas aeruginosa]|uniref:hypothetical protein n=1 Tax=Pseudomonas aeruginosa TaxID=287 RepID=UPI001968B158
PGNPNKPSPDDFASQLKKNAVEFSENFFIKIASCCFFFAVILHNSLCVVITTDFPAILGTHICTMFDFSHSIDTFFTNALKPA